MIIKAFKAILKEGAAENAEERFRAKEAELYASYFNSGKLMNVNVFQKEKEIYVYIESVSGEITPELLFSDLSELFCPWPEEEYGFFYPITEIYHAMKPQSAEHWHRREKPQFCFAMLAKIKPELAARYIFYHYQLQEEKPGAGDKYSRIFLLGDTAFYYGEMPERKESAPYRGELFTDNSPKGDAWQQMMGEHFIWWESKFQPIPPSYDWDKNGYPYQKTNNQWLYIKPILTVV